MKKLIKMVNEVRNTDISGVIDKRMKEFETVGASKEDVFLELCFCLMTANFKAEKSWEIQREIGKDFFLISQDDLAKRLKEMGHRFWPQRAERIVLMRENFEELYGVLGGDLGKAELEIREHFVNNVKGLGMKESSHFLRNIGFNDSAIIDFHIVDLLVNEGLIERPKTITPKKYVEIESILRELGNKLGMGLGELDLYLWYIETGKVLK